MHECLIPNPLECLLVASEPTFQALELIGCFTRRILILLGGNGAFTQPSDEIITHNLCREGTDIRTNYIQDQVLANLPISPHTPEALSHTQITLDMGDALFDSPIREKNDKDRNMRPSRFFRRSLSAAFTSTLLALALGANAQDPTEGEEALNMQLVGFDDLQ